MRLQSFNTIPLRLPWLVCVWLGFFISATVCATAQDRPALQQAILEGLATGQDVGDLLKTLQHQPTLSAPTPVRHTVAGDLHERLLTLQQALFQITRTPSSAAAQSALLHAYQQVQAAHMLMTVHMQGVEHTLVAATLPEALTTRHQDTSTHYTTTLEHLLAPLRHVVAQLQQTPDGTATTTADASQPTLQQAAEETLALLAPHLQTPPRPMLRAQALPVRPVLGTPRRPRLTPAIQPSYLHPDVSQVPPTPEDLADTLDAPLHTEILAQAQALDYDYVRLYEFVRNTIRTEWYAGAMKGALGTLRQQSGNAVDQASLLIALLRASGAPARYVHGVIRLPISQVRDSFGLSHTPQATRALSAAGLAYQPVIQGGDIAAIDMEYTWVTTHVPYTNYRGTLVDPSGPLWLPLMPALKPMPMTPATEILRAMERTATTLVNDYLAQPQATDLRSVLEQEITTYLQTQGSEATYAQQLRTPSIVAQTPGLLPASLPAAVTAVTAETPALDDTHRQHLRVVARQGMQDNAAIILDYTLPVSEVAGERLTLSYMPATVDEQRLVNLYGGLDYTPAYLVTLRPQLKRQGRLQAVATAALTAGTPYRCELHLLGPGGSETVSHTFIAGAYHAIDITAQGVAPLRPVPAADTETPAAALLYRVAHDYSAQWTQAEQEFAGLLDVALVRPWPAVVVVSNAMRLATVLGQPQQLTWEGVTIDAALRVSTPLWRDGRGTPEHDWLRLSALHGSSLEHHVFEQLFLVDSMSADKGLQLARTQGLAVQQVTAQNLSAVLPTLTHPPDVLHEITAWVGLGMTVEVPTTPIQYRDWYGSIWRVDDPSSGASGYFITGGLAGGATSMDPTAWALTLLRDALATPNTAEANRNRYSAASISKLLQTDKQMGSVGEPLAQPLAVLVRDQKGAPVQGAVVTFRVTVGGGCLTACPSATQDVPTNALGVATVPVILGQKTSEHPYYVRLRASDLELTRVSRHLIDASVSGADGVLLRTDLPFLAIASPQPASRLRWITLYAPPDPNGMTTWLWLTGVDAPLRLIVAAVDPYDNPVANVPVSFQTSSPALPGFENCSYVPAHFLGRHNMASCHIDLLTAVAGQCGSPSYSETTTSHGLATADMLPARCTSVEIETITVSSLDLPSLLLSYRPAHFPTKAAYVLTTEEFMDAEGNPAFAVPAGLQSPYPTRAFLYRLNKDRIYERVRAPEGIDVLLDSGCASPNPMRYLGDGVYETFVTPAPTPGKNRLTARARIDSRNNSTVSEPLPDVTGYTVRFTGATALDVPAGVPADVMHLDATSRTQYTVHLGYTIAPLDYRATAVELDLFADNVWQGSMPGTARSGTGYALVPRGIEFTSTTTYAVEIVLNRDTVLESRSRRFPLRLRSPLILSATQLLRLEQEVDVVNARSCVVGADFNFELSEEAFVSLVFSDKDDPQRTVTVLDNSRFAAGRHRLPFYPDAAATLATPSGSLYTLPPGQYVFALTAVGTNTPPAMLPPPPLPPPPPSQCPQLPAAADDDPPLATTPNTGSVIGGALVEYQTPQLPVGHTMVKDVDVATGNLVLSRPDVHVPGRGIPLEFRRAYASNSSTMPGPLGLGWSHNYQSRLLLNRCGDMLVTGSPGSVRFMPAYTQTGALVWQPLKGSHATLRHDPASNTFGVYSTDGTHYHYRHFGYQVMGQPAYELEWIADTNGNVTTLAYDLSAPEYPKLITVADPARRTLIFTYENKVFTHTTQPTPTPVITRMIGPDGQELHFDYDTTGHLVRVAREQNTRVETYTYTPPLLQIRRPGVLKTVTNPNGHTTTYGYNEHWTSAPVETTVLSGDNTAQTQTIAVNIPYASVLHVVAPASGTTTFDYQFAAHRTLVTSGRGYDTLYTTNQDGAVISIHDPLGGTTTTTWLANESLPASRTNARGVPTTSTYDSDGNLLSDTVADYTTTSTYTLLGNDTIKNRLLTQTDRNGHTTRFSYDSRGNLLRVTDAAGGMTIHTYAGNGDRLSTMDPNDNLTRYTYDLYGNVATVTDPLNGVTRTTWDVRSRPLTLQDALGRATTQHYDTLNRLVQRTDPLGNARTWTYDPVGNKLSDTDEAGRTTTFQYDAANRVTAVINALGDTKTTTYDAQGNATGESDFRGNLTTFGYDHGDRRIRRLQPLGRLTTWSHDAVGNLLSETDALGQATRFAYDRLNRRIHTTDALGGITETQYDGAGNVVAQTDANGHTTAMTYDVLDRLLSRTDPLGHTTTYTYDSNGNQTTDTDANGHRRTRLYDPRNRVIQRLDAFDNGTAFEYDAVGNLSRQIDAKFHVTAHSYDDLNRRTQTTDPSGAILSYAYDAVGNRLRESWPNGNLVTSTYDALNRLTTRADALGTLTTATYDTDGNRLTDTDANGNTTSNTYNALNQLTRQDLPADRMRTVVYNRVGKKIAEIDPNEHTTTYAYDALHRLTQTTDPLGHATTSTYDAVGNRLTDTNPRQHTTTFQYDAANRRTTTTDPFGNSILTAYDPVGNTTTETNKRGIPTTSTYDKENRLLTTTTAGVVRRTLEYDAVGNVATDTDANGNITAFLHDSRNLKTDDSRPLAAITTHTYDAMGDRATTRDPEGRISTFTYDLRRRLRTDTNGAGETTTSTYDGNGNRTSRQRPVGNTWTYAYDAANRLTSVRDPLGAITQYTYDDNGNRLSHTDAAGSTTLLAYDARNQLIAMHSPDGATTLSTYDATGNRTATTDPNGQTTHHTYDALNRLTHTTYSAPATPTGDDLQQITYAYDGSNNLLQVIETYGGTAGTRITTRSYDDLDRLTDTTDSSGHSLSYTYDSQGNRLTLSASTGHATRSTHDALNRLASVTTPHGVTVYHYDRSSRLTHTRYPQGTVTTQSYDAAGRVSRLAHAHQGTVVATYAYAYDANGNRLTQRETQGGPEDVTTYTYDSADRLLTVAYPDVATTYTYDTVGNRLTEQTLRRSDGQVVADKTSTYNARHQVTIVTDNNDAAQTVTYTYDDNGNRIEQTVASQTITALYDARNHLRQRTQDGTSLEDFLYDWQGLRVRKATPNETVRYVYDGQQMLLVTDDDNAPQQHYTWGAKRPLAMDDTTDGPQYYLLDALGSVVGLSRPDGSLQTRTQYDAWGQLHTTTGASGNRLGFTGHERDADSGLYYAKARYYDPSLGSFLSTDPATADLTNPPSFHPYLYAYANPTVYLDPDGQQSVSTLIDQAAEGCGVLSCFGYALLKGAYHATTFGFATVHDPVRDAYDHGRVTGGEYLTYGVGGGLAAVGVNVAASAAGGAAAGAATTAVGRVLVSGGLGAVAAAADDALQQGTQVATGLQEAYRPEQTAQAAAVGFMAGSATTAVAEGISAIRASRAVELPDARQSTAPDIHEVVEHPADVSPARLETPPPAQEGLGPHTGAQRLQEEGAKGRLPRANFEVSANGTAIPTSKARLEQGFKDAGFESYPNRRTAEAGAIYRDPNNGNLYRVMEGSTAHPPRLMTHAPGGNPVLPDGRGIPGGLTREQIRDLTHFPLEP